MNVTEMGDVVQNDGRNTILDGDRGKRPREH